MRTWPRARVVRLMIALLGLLAILPGCGRRPAGNDRVTVYSALDREFSEPILSAYEHGPGVRVLPKFDVESTKTVGLTNLIIAEAADPRCDLFWNNEILNTLRLKEKGLLAPFHPANAGAIPPTFKAKDGTWYGFAARARILIVNTQLVAEADRPDGHRATCSTRSGRGRSASPSRSSARRRRTPPACSPPGATRRPGRSSRPEGQRGPGPLGQQAGRQAVGSGQIAFGLTDTDDAMGEIDAGSPVAIVYPDRQPRRARHAVHPQHPGDHQGRPPPPSRRGAGRRPA